MTPEPVSRMLADDLASATLGIELRAAGPGRAEVSMTVTETMVNGHGIGHGGYVFLLADTAFACACNSHGPVTVAAGADITFVSAARLGDVLVARAAERTVYGRSGIYDVTVTRDGGAGSSDGAGGAGADVVAEFRGRSRTLR